MIAGTIDIGSASVIYRASPLIIMRAIAGGVLGKASIDGGLAISLLGLILQWAMSMVIAGIYVTAAVWLAPLRKYPLASGCAYGVVVFFVMEYIVLPLSALARWPNFTVLLFAQLMLAMLLFGTIIAYTARRLLGADP